MILGDTCTRRCHFCAVQTGKPKPVDTAEPQRVAQAALELELDHVVITSVTRDDLTDEGAGIFRDTILEIRKKLPLSTVEVLVPDFGARRELIEMVCSANPDVFNHNLETVERLTPVVRWRAEYRRSLEVLRLAKEIRPNLLIKSGVMLGLGETESETVTTLSDLRTIGCDIVTLGQYLKPGAGQMDVVEFCSPEIFRRLEKAAREMGFSDVYAGPYVRSSYHAKDTYQRVQLEMSEAG